MPRLSPDPRQVFRELVLEQDRRGEGPLLETYLLVAHQFRISGDQVRRIAEQGVAWGWLDLDPELQLVAGGEGNHVGD